MSAPRNPCTLSRVRASRSSGCARPGLRIQVTGTRPADLARSTALHEFGHAVFDAPALLKDVENKVKAAKAAPKGTDQ